MYTMSRSKIWQHFNKTDNYEASCNYCNSVLKHGGTTTCLWNHYNFKHKLSNGVDSMQVSSSAHSPMEVDDSEVNPSPLKRKRTSRVSASVNHSTEISQERQEVITQALTKMLTMDLFPTSFVENQGFKYFINIVEPGYKVPCRKTMRKRIEALYTDEMAKVYEKINSVDTGIALTTDGWTSRSLDSYLAVTGIQTKK